MTTWARSVGDPPADNDPEDKDNVHLACVKWRARGEGCDKVLRSNMAAASLFWHDEPEEGLGGELQLPQSHPSVIRPEY